MATKFDPRNSYANINDGVYGAHRSIGYMGQGTIASKTYAWIKNNDANNGITALGN